MKFPLLNIDGSKSDSIEISDKTDKKLFRIVSFVISSIITRITKNTKKI